MPLGLPGRLSKGAGTHLASWLQQVSNVPEEEAIAWLESPRHERTNEAVAALQHCHGKTVGHAGQILDAAFSGDLLVTKDATSLRLWRARCAVGDQRYCGFFLSICLASVCVKSIQDDALLTCVACFRRDGSLLRVLSGCAGDSVAFSSSGHNIVTGTLKTGRIKIWGAAGGSAVGCGKRKITNGKA